MWEHVVDPVEDKAGHCFEDRAGCAGDVAWILDGAGAVSSEKLTNDTDRSDARWLVDALDGELRSLAPQQLSLDKTAALAIEQAARRADTEWATKAVEIPPSAALGAVRRVREQTSFLVLADVSVILLTDAGAFEFTDQRVDWGNEPARRAVQSALDRGAGFAAARAAAEPKLADRRRSGMNKDVEHGYWIASLDPHAVEHALTGSLDGVREVILATDGFMRVVRPFGLVSDLRSLFGTRSLRELADEVRQAERDDPETLAHPRWTVSDDICAQRLRWVD